MSAKAANLRLLFHDFSALGTFLAAGLKCLTFCVSVGRFDYEDMHYGNDENQSSIEPPREERPPLALSDHPNDDTENCGEKQYGHVSPLKN